MCRKWNLNAKKRKFSFGFTLQKFPCFMFSPRHFSTFLRVQQMFKSQIITHALNNSKLLYIVDVSFQSQSVYNSVVYIHVGFSKQEISSTQHRIYSLTFFLEPNRNPHDDKVQIVNCSTLCISMSPLSFQRKRIKRWKSIRKQTTRYLEAKMSKHSLLRYSASSENFVPFFYLVEIARSYNEWNL